MNTRRNRSRERAAFGADGRGGAEIRTNLRTGSKRGQTHTGSPLVIPKKSAGLGMSKANPSSPVEEAEGIWIRSLFEAKAARERDGEWSASYRNALEAARYARQIYERVRREAAAS